MLNKDKFLTFVVDSKDKIKEMLENQKIKMTCWICGRKQDELIYALISVKNSTDKNYIGFTGEAKEFKTKITAYSLDSKQFNELRIPVCMTCRFLIPEIIKLSSEIVHVKLFNLCARFFNESRY